MTSTRKIPRWQRQSFFRQRPWQLRLKRPKLHSLKTIVIKRSPWIPYCEKGCLMVILPYLTMKHGSFMVIKWDLNNISIGKFDGILNQLPDDSL